MKVISYEGVVENGSIQLPPGVVLPEHATVYVVIPEMKEQWVVHLRSPRLADPTQAARLELEVIEEGTDAGL